MEPTPDYGSYANTKSSLMDRLKGVVLFKAPIYREIADDQEATGTAAMILVIVAVITGAISGLFQSAQLITMLQDPQFREMGMDPAVFAGLGAVGLAVFGAIITPLLSLISWLISSWLNAFIATTLFKGKTNTSEMLRVFGFVSIFNLISIIPCGGLVALVLSVIGGVIGVREAAEFDTGNAVLTVIISYIVVLVVVFLIFFCIIFGLAAALSAAGN